LLTLADDAELELNLELDVVADIIPAEDISFEEEDII